MFHEKSLVIFDFDGVLVDSVEVKTDAFAELYEPYGIDIVDKVINHHRTHGGVSRFDKFKHYHESFLGVSLTEDDLANLSDCFTSIVMDKVIVAPEIDGAYEFLRRCNDANLTCAVNSATPDSEIKKIVKSRGWEDLFCCVHGAPSSKSENLNEIILSQIKTPSDAVFFGDAESDLIGAMNSSVEFIGIGKGMLRASDNQKKFPAFYDFNDLLEVMSNE